MKRRKRAMGIMALVAGLATAAQATIIRPIWVISEEYAFQTASWTIDNSRMVTPVWEGDTLASALNATHEFGDHLDSSYISTDPGGYPSDFFASLPGGDTAVDLVYDLTGFGDTEFGSILIWNYEYFAGLGNQLRTIEVRVNTEAEGETNFNGTPITITLKPVADGDTDPSNDLGGVNAAQFFSLGPQNGRYVQISLTDNFYELQGNVDTDGGDRVCFGEVRFATETSAPLQPPVISSFSASATLVTNGTTVTLSWSTENEETLTIDPGIGDVTGLTSTQTRSSCL